VTEAARRKLQSAPQPPRLASPFAPLEQPRYQFDSLPGDPGPPELLRLSFQPQGRLSSELLIGEALVDPEAGEMVQLWGRPAKNPAWVEALRIDAEFATQTRVGRAISRLEVHGEAGLPWFKKRFRFTTVFSDYWLPSSLGA
jgi:hypothetical protein